MDLHGFLNDSYWNFDEKHGKSVKKMLQPAMRLVPPLHAPPQHRPILGRAMQAAVCGAVARRMSSCLKALQCYLDEIIILYSYSRHAMLLHIVLYIYIYIIYIYL